MSADLEQAIKKTRLRARQKQPLAGSAYQVVATLVAEFHLEGGFLQQLADLDLEVLLRRSLAAAGCQPRLFPLLPEATYQVALALWGQYDNPYLIYSRNPWEIRISRELARRWPDLPPKILATRSITAIFLELEQG